MTHKDFDFLITKCNHYENYVDIVKTSKDFFATNSDRVNIVFHIITTGGRVIRREIYTKEFIDEVSLC